MSHENIIRAWKDESFRNSLSEEEQSLLPENPAGLVELADEQLDVAAGGRVDLSYVTHACMCGDTP
jgi:mersacidin/lichenicidin family type 2 lantibiotic